MKNFETITIDEQIATLEYYLLFAETNEDVISLNNQIEKLTANN